MAQLTKLERVMRTMRFEETDRVPLYDIFQNDAVIAYYGGAALTDENAEYVKGLAIGCALDMTRMPEGPQQSRIECNESGLLLRHERWTSWIIERPFGDMPQLVEWVKGEIKRSEALTYDRTYAERFHRRIRDHQAVFAKADPTGRGDPTVMIVESGVGLTEPYWMTDMEMFAWLMTDYPDLLDEWLLARNNAELRRVEAIADPRVIPLALTYDDIAYKTATLFSPAWLRAHWLPGLKRLVEAWHNRDVYCIFHSDGNLWSVLDDLVSAGIDGLNPLEVLAGMTVEAVRARYPNLVLTGGIDVSDLLVFGSPQDVRLACRAAMQAAQKRGYLMGSSTELHWDVPLDNAIAMYESVHDQS